MLYFRPIGRAGPAFISQLSCLIPQRAVLLGGLPSGERPTVTDHLAMAVIPAGVALSQRTPLTGETAPADVAPQHTGG